MSSTTVNGDKKQNETADSEVDKSETNNTLNPNTEKRKSKYNFFTDPFHTKRNYEELVNRRIDEIGF